MFSYHLSKIGGVVVQSPLLAIREYEIEHGVPDNYINCLMWAFRRETYDLTLMRDHVSTTQHGTGPARGLAEIRARTNFLIPLL